MAGQKWLSATALVGLLAYVSLHVFRTGQWPPSGWHAIWNMPIRTGRQATIAAMLLLLMAVAALVYSAVMVSLLEPVPEEQREVPMKSV